MTPTLSPRAKFLLLAAAFSPLLLAAPSFTASAGARHAADRPIRASACFSPGGGCESRIVEMIAAAKKNIRVQMYFFTSKRIGQALAQAAKHGIKVDIILDKSQEKAAYGPWRVMRRDGVRIYFDDKHETANNKIVLIDKRVVITGSYNFTKAAEEKNAENVIIIEDDRDLFDAYLENFNEHLEHARKAAS